jgi:transcriptional regulator with XRE-family HTH domain
MCADLMGELVTELEDQRNRLLGRHIRELRLRAGLSTERVADRMRDAGHHTWTAQTLSDIQRHGTRRPTAVSTLEARDLAPILGVTLEHLVNAPGLPEPAAPPAAPDDLARHAEVLEQWPPSKGLAGSRRVSAFPLWPQWDQWARVDAQVREQGVSSVEVLRRCIEIGLRAFERTQLTPRRG